MEKEWTVYILACRDGTLYTGITDDLDKRLALHASGKGAKYTRGRGPFTLAFCKKVQSRSHALKEEYRIKQLARKEKQMLCDGMERKRKK